MSTDILGPANAPGAVTVRPGDTRTFGSSDTWVKDCTSAGANDGTKVQAGFVNALVAALRNLTRGNGQTAGAVDIVTQDNTDDGMMLKAVQHLIQRGLMKYNPDTSGAANTITVSLTPALAEYKTGLEVDVLLANTNVSGALNININALGNKRVKTISNADPLAGAMPSGAMAKLVYDGTNFQIISVLSPAGFALAKAKISLGAIASGSIPFGTWTTHATSLAASNDITPTVNSNNFVLPAGTYLITCNGSTTLNSVAANTVAAWQMRVTQNGTEIGRDSEFSYMPNGANATTYRNLVTVVTVAAGDVLNVQSWLATTTSGDFVSGSASAGVCNVIKLG